MNDYISRQTTIDDLREILNDPNCPLFISATIHQILESIPAADVLPVVYGEWVDVSVREVYIPDEKTTIAITTEKCSNCRIVTTFVGEKLYLEDHICPNCGAILRSLED